MIEPVDILLEDGPVLAINKPAGLLIEGPPSIADTLVTRVKRMLKQRDAKPGNVYLGIPHRLDRAVSGVVLFAKNSKCARRLAEQFRDRKVRKFYWAIVPSAPNPQEGTWTDWIVKEPDRAYGRVVETGASGAKEASLSYRTLKVTDAGALIEIELITGRFHQIRIQFASRGLPVLGDRLYGGATMPGPGNEALPVGETSHDEGPIALHAVRLQFLHPIRYDEVTVSAPLPSHWQQFWSSQAPVALDPEEPLTPPPLP